MKNLIVLLVAGLLVISSLAVGITVYNGATVNQVQTGGIRVGKFEDINMNGWRDGGEPYLEGWTIELWEPNGLGGWTKLDELITGGEDCDVYFHDLPVGQYRIKEVLKDDWMSTTGTEKTLTVVADQWTCHRFGNIKTGDICVDKYHDLNENGMWDDGEPGIEDWEIMVYHNDELYTSGMTDAEGHICFQVPIGNYTVVEETREDWIATTPIEVDVEIEHKENEQVEFGNLHYGKIIVCKYYDWNMNGMYDDEEMLEDWEIILYDETGTTELDRGYTDGSGCIEFDMLVPGTYWVEETIPDGWFNTTPAEVEVMVEAGGEHEVWFGNAEYANITIYKFNDYNMDGIYDEGTEPLVGGVPFSGTGGLYGVTDNGILNFPNLMPGIYTITEEVPAGWFATTDTEVEINAGPGDHIELYFGDAEYGHIRVCKYHDVNMNGEYDDEEMLEGWTFNLWTMGGNVTPGERKPLDVVVMIDTSGSMAGTRLNDAKAAAISFMNNLNEDDRMALYTFDGAEDSYLRRDYTYMTPANKTLMQGTINGLGTGGGTPIWDSIGDSITYSQTPANQRGGDVVEIVLALTDGTDYYYVPEAGSEDFCAGSEPGTSAYTHTWGHPDGLKWGDAPKHFENQGPSGGDDVFTYQYNWVDLPEDGEHRTGLIYAPIPVYTVGLGIYHEDDPENPTIGNDYNFTNEYNLWQISETSGAKYFYAPDSEDLEQIFDDIFGEITGGKQKIATNVTGECGCTMFWDLVPGEYIVEEILPYCWHNTTPLEQTVEVVAGETTEVWFGNVQHGNITVCKYWDVDGDGEYDDGEEMLEGWTFNLWTTDELGNPLQIIDTGVTGENGCVKFTELIPGMYAVQEVLNDCWYNTTPLIQYVEVEGCGDFEVWFGNNLCGGIYGMKYKDIEADGMFDVGLDEPLMGWEINLWSVNESNGQPLEILKTTTTNRCGMYYFDCVCPGEYYVQEVIPNGWYNVTPALVKVTVMDSEEIRVDFANCMYKYIYGIKFYDYNMNGMYDERTDWVLPDWEIELYDETGTVLIDRTYTEECGYYWFEGLTVGTYIVREVIPDGWFNTTPMEYMFDITCCSPCMVFNFGNCEYGNITIYKFNDLNKDGIYDEGTEPLVDGVPFTAGMGMSGLSGDSGFGKLVFEYVMPGMYTVTETLPYGWVNTTPMEVDINVLPGGAVEIYFGNVEFGNLRVCKYYDDDLDGEYDDGEDMLAGWTFNLWNTTNGEPDTIIDENITCDDGCAMFWELQPGLYAVQEVQQQCYCNTTPLIQYIEVVAGETVELWFGNAECGTVSGYKFCDFNMNGVYDDEDGPLEGWTIYLEVVTPPVVAGNLNAAMLWTTTTDADGYYEFDCVCPMAGTYTIYEEMPDGWYNTTPVEHQFTIGCGEDLQFNFGNYRLGDIVGCKYCDVERDGEFDVGLDKPIEGVEINLWSYNESNGMPKEIIATTYTDNCGCYMFEDLMPGYYFVQEVLTCGWMNVTPDVVMVKLGCVEEVNVNFANWRYGEITVFKYYDENNNGVFDDGIDWPLEGWEIVLWTVNETTGQPETPIATGFTCENGYYIFSDLEPGHYAVQDVIPRGWASSTDPIQFVTVRCCCVWVEFGNYEIEFTISSNSGNSLMCTDVKLY